MKDKLSTFPKRKGASSVKPVPHCRFRRMKTESAVTVQTLCASTARAQRAGRLSCLPSLLPRRSIPQNDR